jgi:hypothetical protein
LPAERSRAPRWPIREDAVVTVTTPGGSGFVLNGVAVNASLEGVRLQLPVALAEGSHVSVALAGGAPRTGTVRWALPHGESGFLHGIRFHVPADLRGKHSKLHRRLLVRRGLRRGLIVLVGAASIAIAAYGLGWFMDAMRAYDPQYYEPKDIERERHLLQRQPVGLETSQQPSER